MFNKRYSNRLINRSDIHERIKLIENSETDYISELGFVYKKIGNKFLKKKNILNKYNGYLYTTITTLEGQKQFRLHRLVAKAFVKNPNNLNVVMHLDNDKQNPYYKNLKWGTISENTKQAFRDGLIKNAKSWEDSQSIPVCMIDFCGNIIEKFGSMREAANKLNMTTTSISYNCINKPLKSRKHNYFIRFLNEFLDLL